jgi:hypothetical protein
VRHLTDLSRLRWGKDLEVPVMYDHLKQREPQGFILHCATFSFTSQELPGSLPLFLRDPPLPCKLLLGGLGFWIPLLYFPRDTNHSFFFFGGGGRV